MAPEKTNKRRESSIAPAEDHKIKYKEAVDKLQAQGFTMPEVSVPYY